MRIEIRDGWPFLNPKVYADGLPPGLHRNRLGDVCLWEDGDPSWAWVTKAGLWQRISDWVRDADAGDEASDPGLDTERYWRPARLGLAIIDLSRIDLRNGLIHRPKARQIGDVLHIGEGPMSGRLYTRDEPIGPLTDLSQLREHLEPHQAADLDVALRHRRGHQAPRFVVVTWPTAGGQAILALEVAPRRDLAPVLTAMEVARSDGEILRLRSGRDQRALTGTGVVVFGLGGMGSQWISLLARSGLGRAMLIDQQRLRPGDVVRHAASGRHVGMPKVEAVKAVIRDVAPWTEVTAHHSATWAPEQLAAEVRAADLVIDAVGERLFTLQLSLICLEERKPLVSAALYRQGRVARVRVQVPDGATPIFDRSAESGYPIIPAAPGETEQRWEAGCGTPIAESSPIAVASAAALAAKTTADVLCGRLTEDGDLIDVYEPLPDPPHLAQLGLTRLP
jgi:molybdopterin/thiamine biosynthesis adenylyltransferase